MSNTKTKQKKTDFKPSKYKAMNRVERYFKFDTFGATLKKELIGGLTMFLAVLYILSVEPQMLSEAPSLDGTGHMSSFGVFLGMCIATFLSTFVMGLFANIPAIVAPSMGVNAMFVYNIAMGGGIGYEGALIATTLSSILFVIFSVTPLRRIVIEAIPKSLQIGIGVGIGFFVAYVGLADMGWTKMDGSIPVAAIGDLKHTYPIVILGSGLVLLMLLFRFLKINGGVAISMGIGLVIALIIANAGPNLSVSKDGSMFGSANFRDKKLNPGWDYDWKGFTDNISNTWTVFTEPKLWTNPVMYISIFMFIFLNFFDATGTLMTFNNQLNKATGLNRPLPNSSLVIDSAATVVGSALGVSPLGAFVESGAGIAQGARTGLASIFASFYFLLAIALFPIFKAVPPCVSGAACVYVGISMMESISEIDWKAPEFAISVFLGVLFMMAQYTITNGIAIMFIVYTFIMMVRKHFKQVPIPMYVLSVLFIGYFVACAFM